MYLAELLSRGAICMDIRSSRREDAVRELLEALVTDNRLPAQMLEASLEAVEKREKLGSTAIGNGVAVPHARLQGLDGTVIAIGLSKEGVEFRALDGEPVHQVFLVLGPEEHPDDYIEVMRRISGLLQNGDFRRFMSKSGNPEDVIALFQEMDGAS